MRNSRDGNNALAKWGKGSLLGLLLFLAGYNRCSSSLRSWGSYSRERGRQDRGLLLGRYGSGLGAQVRATDSVCFLLLGLLGS